VARVVVHLVAEMATIFLLLFRATIDMDGLPSVLVRTFWTLPTTAPLLL